MDDEVAAQNEWCVSGGYVRVKGTGARAPTGPAAKEMVERVMFWVPETWKRSSTVQSINESGRKALPQRKKKE